MNEKEYLKYFSEQFSGFSVDYRRYKDSWPEEWRARIIANSNTRKNYRITVYADNIDSLFSKLKEELDKQRLEGKKFT